MKFCTKNASTKTDPAISAIWRKGPETDMMIDGQGDASHISSYCRWPQVSDKKGRTSEVTQRASWPYIFGAMTRLEAYHLPVFQSHFLASHKPKLPFCLANNWCCSTTASIQWPSFHAEFRSCTVYGSHRVEQLCGESNTISRRPWRFCKIAKFTFRFSEGFVAYTRVTTGELRHALERLSKMGWSTCSCCISRRELLH